LVRPLSKINRRVAVRCGMPASQYSTILRVTIRRANRPEGRAALEFELAAVDHLFERERGVEDESAELAD
jgi:hypothetical protein